ncbi:MAG TPA: MBL fold metallo-hydrolase [Planctomycetota bacterium]|nr:MBL fold metallo-hydrolase [Planctomycetota bacterium]
MFRAWRRLIGVAALGVALMISLPAAAQAAEAHMRVIDVGTGLCVVARTPAGQVMVYDTGPRGTRCLEGIRHVIPSRASRRAAAPDDPQSRPVIDLLVLSHSDLDHIGGAARILRDYQVLHVLHPGDDRPLGAASNRTMLGEARDAIAASGAEDWSLADVEMSFGDPIDLGAATATFIAGWHDGSLIIGEDEASLPEGERNNGLSIVIRYEYGGHSVLLTGDTVGRLDGAAKRACDYAEQRMVERAQADDADERVPIQSDVLIGQHHGGDDASSMCFIAEVRPTYVVLSAGHHDGYVHPRASAARRVLDALNETPEHDIQPENILRTDHRDNQGRPEWIFDALRGCVDDWGDDDVDIFMPEGEPIRVEYRYAGRRCDARQ